MNPVKPTLKTELAPLLLLIASLAVSFYFYSVFPEQVPIHWNAAGEPDNYGSRAVGAFLMPAFGAGLYVLFLVLPYIDPKKERYEQFRKVYHFFKISIISVFFLIYVISGLNILGYGFPIDLWVPVIIGILFIVMGNYMGKIKKNWFMGIRTPWTLSSEEVWNKTHRFGGKVFIFGGVLLAATAFVPVSFRMWILIVDVLALSLGTIVYSYVIYKKSEKKDVDNQFNQS